eukprot:scaffold100_cov357-Prasinococcus_capsulatus_cf.AAC.14
MQRESPDARTRVRLGPSGEVVPLAVDAQLALGEVALTPRPEPRLLCGHLFAAVAPISGRRTHLGHRSSPTVTYVHVDGQSLGRGGLARGPLFLPRTRHAAAQLGARGDCERARGGGAYGLAACARGLARGYPGTAAGDFRGPEARDSLVDAVHEWMYVRADG